MGSINSEIGTKLLTLKIITMKKLFYIITAVLLVSNLSFAQNRTSEKDLAIKVTESLKTNLELNQDQTKQVEIVMVEVVKKIDEAKKIQDASSMQKSIKDINDYRDKELKKILTPQQYEKLNSNNQGRKCVKCE